MCSCGGRLQRNGEPLLMSHGRVGSRQRAVSPETRHVVATSVCFELLIFRHFIMTTDVLDGILKMRAKMCLCDIVEGRVRMW